MIYRNFHDAGFRFFGIKGLDETGTVCECGKKECAYNHPWFSSWQHTLGASDVVAYRLSIK